MLTDVVIANQREDFDYQIGGRAVRGTRTTFMVGPDGPFSVFLSDADFTPSANLAAIEAKADAVRGTRDSHKGRP
jgi:hypothetical protein